MAKIIEFRFVQRWPEQKFNKLSFSLFGCFISLDQWMDQPILGADQPAALAVISRMNVINSECSIPFTKQWSTAIAAADMITPPQTPPEMSMDSVKVRIWHIVLTIYKTALKNNIHRTIVFHDFLKQKNARMYAFCFLMFFHRIVTYNFYFCL